MKPSSSQVDYIIWNTINILPFISEDAKYKSSKLISEYINKIRNINLSELLNRESKIPKIENQEELIIIPMKRNTIKWDEQIKYCRDRNGMIDEIEKDQIAFPTDSQITLY